MHAEETHCERVVGNPSHTVIEGLPVIRPEGQFAAKPWRHTPWKGTCLRQPTTLAMRVRTRCATGKSLRMPSGPGMLVENEMGNAGLEVPVDHGEGSKVEGGMREHDHPDAVGCRENRAVNEPNDGSLFSASGTLDH